MCVRGIVAERRARCVKRLARVLEAIGRFAQGYRGEAWTPAPLLVRLAAEGKGFGQA